MTTPAGVMNGNTLKRFDATIRALAPILNVGVTDPTTPATTSHITFDPTATAPQISAANSALASFDWSDAATATWVQGQNPDLHSLIASATAAINQINTFQAIGSPTQAQFNAATTALVADMKGVIQAVVKLAQAITS